MDDVKTNLINLHNDWQRNLKPKFVRCLNNMSEQAVYKPNNPNVLTVLKISGSLYNKLADIDELFLNDHLNKKFELEKIQAQINQLENNVTLFYLTHN